MSDATTTVRRNDDSGRYEVFVGDDVAGFTTFEQSDQGLVFAHTVIDEAFAGRGLGSTLVGEAMADLVTRGEAVVPVCPFVVAYLRKREVPGLVVNWPAE